MMELLEEISVGFALQAIIVSFVLGFCAVFAGLIIRFRMKSGDLRRLRKMVQAPAVPIAQVRSPVAKIEGTVGATAAGTVRSPLTGRECVTYRIAVDRHSTSRGGELDTTTLHEERDARDFYLQDATGHARIVVGDALLMTTRDSLAHGGVPAPAVQATLAGWAHQRGISLAGRTSVSEERVEVGQHAMVHGRASRAQGEVVLAGASGDPLVIATARQGQVRVRGCIAHLDRIAIGIGCVMMLAPVLLVSALVGYVLLR